MRTLVVVSDPDDWPLTLPGVGVVAAGDYLTDPVWTKDRGLRVFNLCRSYRYQSEGYYVSLLATARRHLVFPALMTVLDMKSRSMVRSVDEELDDLIQRSLGSLRSERFVLSVYFGVNPAERHARLASKIFGQFPAPLLRAHFSKGDDRWRLSRIDPIPVREVPDSLRPFLLEAAERYFSRPRFRSRASRSARYDMAILWADEELAPSSDRTIKRMESIAQKVGFGVERVDRDDYGRLAEFDALFIRETTAVNHYTFRFAQRAEAEGLAVIDDPQSILRCSNKVFLKEALEVRGIPMPSTWVTNRVDVDEVGRRLGFPCVLKAPDSSFSQGVIKCEDAPAFERAASEMLEDSDLLLIQEYTPSEYDWRIGIFEDKVLFACRYHMAPGHWQIIQKTDAGRFKYGRTDTLPLDLVPRRILQTARRAAAAIGNGLYGVDLKQIGSKVVVMEVNDNPNIDVGCEDTVIGDELYYRIMQGFLERVEARKRGNGR